MIILPDRTIDMCVADQLRCTGIMSLHAPSPRVGQSNKAKVCDCERLTFLRREHARLSARAAQARGLGEWVLAAQLADRMASLGVGSVPAQRR